MRSTAAKPAPQRQPYFGGPEAKVPTSSNKSSCEREDLALTGVSCSITCISDSTEWETELWREAGPGRDSRVGIRVAAQEKTPSCGQKPTSPSLSTTQNLLPLPAPRAGQGPAGSARPCEELERTSPVNPSASSSPSRVSRANGRLPNLSDTVRQTVLLSVLGLLYHEPHPAPCGTQTNGEEEMENAPEPGKRV